MTTVREVSTETISPLVNYKSPLIVITDNGIVYEVKSAYEYEGKVTIFKDNETLKFPVGAVKVIPKEDK